MDGLINALLPLQQCTMRGGSGVLTIALVLAAAIAGTWLYGYLRPQLPH